MYDHAKKSYKFGFRLLTLGWSDGNTFLPVNSCLLSSENTKNRIIDAKPLDKRTVGYSRRRLAQTKATSVMLELIDMAKSAGLPASYVLIVFNSNASSKSPNKQILIASTSKIMLLTECTF